MHFRSDNYKDQIREKVKRYLRIRSHVNADFRRFNMRPSVVKKNNILMLGKFTKRSKSFEKVMAREKEDYQKRVQQRQRYKKAKRSTLKSVFLGNRIYTDQKYRQNR